MSEASGAGGADGIALATRGAEAATDLGRPDLAEGLLIAATRVRRPRTIVCVVGEFKQGKSSLVNALLGASVCPVDDDLATAAITVIHDVDRPGARVRLAGPDGIRTDQIEPGMIAEFASESGNPANARRVERVEIGLTHPLLAEGLMLVDTPGAGGLGAGHAAATLAFLPFADGLIFVSDASAELSAPELDFLRAAAERCPLIIFGLTKTDISSDWRRIAELDRGHLDRAGLRIPIVPLAAPVRELALRRSHSELDRASGYPELIGLIRARVMVPAKGIATRRAFDETARAMDQLGAMVRARLQLLEDPASLESVMTQLEAATRQLEHLKGPAARWGQVVADRVTDLSGAVTHDLRGSLRALGREMDEAIETVRTPADWEAIGQDLTTRVADLVAGVFRRVETGAQEIRAELAELIGELPEPRALGDRMDPLDIRLLWTSASIEERGSRAGGALGSALAGLRGAQSGVFTLGFLTRLLPAGAAAIALSTPITLGLGAAFAGQQLLEVNRRKISARRQRARLAVRQFLDDVQFEVTNQLAESVKSIQRTLRDEVGGHLADLQRSYAEIAGRARSDAQRTSAERSQQAAQARADLERLDLIRRELDRARLTATRVEGRGDPR